MTGNNKTTVGTIDLQGEQTYFNAAIAKALGMDPQDDHFIFVITIDILRSLMNEELTYRVDYTMETSPFEG